MCVTCVLWGLWVQLGGRGKKGTHPLVLGHRKLPYLIFYSLTFLYSQQPPQLSKVNPERLTTFWWGIQEHTVRLPLCEQPWIHTDVQIEDIREQKRLRLGIRQKEFDLYTLYIRLVGARSLLCCVVLCFDFRHFQQGQCITVQHAMLNALLRSPNKHCLLVLKWGQQEMSKKVGYVREERVDWLLYVTVVWSTRGCQNRLVTPLKPLDKEAKKSTEKNKLTRIERPVTTCTKDALSLHTIHMLLPSGALFPVSQE